MHTDWLQISVFSLRWAWLKNRALMHGEACTMIPLTLGFIMVYVLSWACLKFNWAGSLKWITKKKSVKSVKYIDPPYMHKIMWNVCGLASELFPRFSVDFPIKTFSLNRRLSWHLSKVQSKVSPIKYYFRPQLSFQFTIYFSCIYQYQ